MLQSACTWVLTWHRWGEFLNIKNLTVKNGSLENGQSLGDPCCINLIPFSTVPCIPTNVAAVRDCGAGSLTVTWSISHGAIFYVAIAEDSEGTIHRCNSMDISCTIENLKCNTDYEVYVYASTSLCDSSDSERVASKTGTENALQSSSWFTLPKSSLKNFALATFET